MVTLFAINKENVLEPELEKFVLRQGYGVKKKPRRTIASRRNETTPPFRRIPSLLVGVVHGICLMEWVGRRCCLRNKTFVFVLMLNDTLGANKMTKSHLELRALMLRCTRAFSTRLF